MFINKLKAKHGVAEYESESEDEKVEKDIEKEETA